MEAAAPLNDAIFARAISFKQLLRDFLRSAARMRMTRDPRWRSWRFTRSSLAFRAMEDVLSGQ
jgi:hypothetical protein